MTRTIWGSPENFLTGKWLGQALRRAADLKIITADDVRYSTDDHIWDLLCSSQDTEILLCVHKITHCRNYFAISEDYDVVASSKFRGVDPLVKTQNGLQRLSELDKNFAAEYARIKNLNESGWKIMLTNGLPETLFATVDLV